MLNLFYILHLIYIHFPRLSFRVTYIKCNCKINLEVSHLHYIFIFHSLFPVAIFLRFIFYSIFNFALLFVMFSALILKFCVFKLSGEFGV